MLGRIHPNFRQFPGVGPCSAQPTLRTFISVLRFQPFTFKPLPREEWEEVIAHKLDGLTCVELLTKEMVSCHVKMNKVIFSGSFPEKKSYAVTSIRELLKVVAHLKWYHRSGLWPQVVPRHGPTGGVLQLLRNEFMNVYVARFRGRGREALQRLISTAETVHGEGGVNWGAGVCLF